MRTFIGVMLLLIVIGVLALTCFYQVNTNASISFSLRAPEEPMTRTRLFPFKALKQGEALPPADPYAVPESVMPTAPQPSTTPALAEPATQDVIPVAEEPED